MVAVEADGADERATADRTHEMVVIAGYVVEGSEVNEPVGVGIKWEEFVEAHGCWTSVPVWRRSVEEGGSRGAADRAIR